MVGHDKVNTFICHSLHPERSSVPKGTLEHGTIKLCELLTQQWKVPEKELYTKKLRGQKHGPLANLLGQELSDSLEKLRFVSEKLILFLRSPYNRRLQVFGSELGLKFKTFNSIQYIDSFMTSPYDK